MKYTLISILFVFILGCSVKGKRGNSMSIEESKSRKVFLFEYTSLLKGKSNVSINEAFIEKSWIYKSNFSTDKIKVIPNSPLSLQIVITFNESKELNNFDEKWNINICNVYSFNRYSNFNCIVCNLDASYKMRDTINLNIQEGYKYWEKTDTIGKIVLIRKSNN